MDIFRDNMAITRYDVFTFETAMRDIVDEYLKPMQAQAEDDRDRVVSTHLTIGDL